MLISFGTGSPDSLVPEKNGLENIFSYFENSGGNIWIEPRFYNSRMPSNVLPVQLPQTIEAGSPRMPARADIS